ncbi:glycosyl hydrolase [Rhizohabitans arisaemae]|uniref:glycosyl hydrolase n=1 Tax=Rhizohabitans arisaemae TaxID=2720610 RepID=UPI0024B05551|nr:glycosyl hydrolase [Rhizohabitans arisaemae]
MSGHRVGDRRTGDLAGLLAALARPYGDHGLVPFLRLNDEIDRERLRAQLARMADQGVGGFFLYPEDPSIHGHDGMPYPYLGAEMAEVVRWILAEAAALGLDVWLYDECDWPSGMAGSRVVDENPERVARRLTVDVAEVTGPVRSPVGAAVCAGIRAGAGPVTPLPISGGAVDVPAGTWELRIVRAEPMAGWFHRRYADLTDDVAAETFCAATHDWYGEVAGDHLGTTVKGWFTDEPTIPFSMVEWGEPVSPRALPYISGLIEEFKREKGYDLGPHLPLLADLGTADQVPEQVRIDYWDVVSRRYASAYFDRIRARCDAQGVDFTGHLMGEEDLDLWLYLQGGDPFRLYGAMTIPGVDWIDPFTGPDGGLRLLPAITPVLAASAAALADRPRVMAEVFAGVGWGVTPDELRRMLDWLAVHGVNLFVPVTWKHSLRGRSRTRFFPPGLSYQQPWWEHASPLVGYAARLCAVLSAGRPVHDAELEFPAGGAGFADPVRLRECSTAFTGELDRLLDAGHTVRIVPSGTPESDVVRYGVRGSEVNAVPNAQAPPAGVRRHIREAEDVRMVALLNAGADPVRWDVERDGPAPKSGSPGRGVPDATPADSRLTGQGGFTDDDEHASGHVAAEPGIRRGAESGFAAPENGGDAGSGWVELDAVDGVYHPVTGPVWLEPGRLRLFLAGTGEEARRTLTDQAVPRPPGGGRTVAELTEWTVTEVCTVDDDPEIAWQLEGWPAGFAGERLFETEFDWSEGETGGVALDLGEVTVTASVALNGVELGIRAFPPYRFDVRPALRHGRNALAVRVRNTLADRMANDLELADRPLWDGGVLARWGDSRVIGPVRLTREADTP